ncbi:type II secretion system protein [Listeria costaricensis]|uniref:type II secretion system protein n=1 Tax=Listeria costaricensis TaxID=2026604 RepID=UPI000C0870C7|nr:type II secretion system protein [Listeria costaricensis]
MKKINGFSLIEGVVSLSVICLITTLFFPLLFQLIIRLHHEQQETTLLQMIADESKLLAKHPIPKEKTVGSYKITTEKQKDRWQICAEQDQTKLCRPE